MEYLFIELLPYEIAAFAFGVLVGWITCARVD